ncbi:MAG TPA: hypothetical protein VKA03_05655 [Methylovirgula sp.]|nr:hypothetical protein [Methylovirgula sp.]
MRHPSGNPRSVERQAEDKGQTSSADRDMIRPAANAAQAITRNGNLSENPVHRSRRLSGQHGADNDENYARIMA